MVKREDLAQLEDLEDRIAKAKAALNPPRAGQDHHSMAQIGWRMVIELVSGLGIGAVFGYGLDAVFGTQPVFLVLLTLLGFAAGVRMMMRSAKEFEPGTGNAAPSVAGVEKGEKASGRE